MALRKSPRTISIWARAVSRAGFSTTFVAGVAGLLLPLVFSGMGFLSVGSALGGGVGSGEFAGTDVDSAATGPEAGGGVGLVGAGLPRTGLTIICRPS